MSRFCPNCGTEVDDTAAFCPTCGQSIDQDAETEMPPAPAWPDPEPPAAAATFEPVEPVERQDAPAADEPEPTRTEPIRRSETHRDAPVSEDGGWQRSERRDEAPSSAPAPPPRAAGADDSDRRAPGSSVDLPITMPVTLSAWLIGGGSALAALGALIALFDGLGSALDILLLLALLAVAASVFLVDRLPHIPQLRLVTLAIVLIAFGVALDRLGFGRAGAGELLLFLGTAAAAMGAILLETGRDQPLGGPSA